MPEKTNWGVVLSSCAGLVTSNGPINTFAFGVFLKPVSAALGVSRGVLSGAMGLALLMTALFSPAFGWAVDKYGFRRCLLWAIPPYAAGLAALCCLPTAKPGIYALFGLAGVLAVGQTPAAYSKAISVWCDKKRGLALGVAISGVGIGTILMPQYALLLLRHVGWRAAYLGLAASVMLCAFLPVVFWLQEKPASTLSAPSSLLSGLSQSQALRSKQFWAIALAFCVAGIVISGVLAQLVAMLSDRGFSPREAASGLSLVGIAIILGRLVSGYALDRIFAPYVAAAFFISPMFGLLLLAFAASPLMALAGTILLGLSIGADIDLVPFLLGRYFGLRHFAQIYGLVFSIFLVGNALGTALLGFGYDLTGSYQALLLGFEPLMVLGCILLLRLGPYRFPVNA